MSEVKFACSVCGQHITADTSNAGGQIECPTCFNKLRVPAAGARPDSKLVLAAATVPAARSEPSAAPPAESRPKRSTAQLVRRTLCLGIGAGALLALFMFRVEIIDAIRHRLGRWGAEDIAQNAERAPSPKPGSGWNLDATLALIPEQPIAGRLRGRPFRLDRAEISGGHLFLKQGGGWPPELSLALHFYAERPEDLAGKAIEIRADRQLPLPSIVVRWVDDEGRPDEQIFSSGYALLASFGEIRNQRLHGQLYVALPDEAKSYAAGVFEAAIQATNPPAPAIQLPTP